MALDFNSILGETVESVERPPLAPLGMYVFAVMSVPKDRENDDYEFVDIPCRGVRPHNVEDMDALKNYGEPKNIIVRKSFLFPKGDEAGFKQAKFQLENFLFNHLGLPMGSTIKEALSAAVGKQFLGELGYRPDKSDAGVMYHDLKKSAPLE